MTTFLAIIILGIMVAKILAIVIEQKGLYFPKKEIEETPKDIKVRYEDVFLKTSDKQILHAWYIKSPKSKQAVLFCHGNAGNMSGRLHRVAFFKELRVNLLMFDYRGYGKSTGRPSEKGLYRDVQTAYDYLIHERNIDPQQIVVYGKSLGCAVIVDLALHNPVGYLVLESPFASVEQVSKEMYPFLPMSWLTQQKYDSVRKIRHIKTPKLIIHGRYDDMIAFRHASLLHQNALPPKMLLPYDGGHNDMDYVTSDEYQDKIQGILKSLEK
ncbi:alpha/beta hydrolase [bacterium]|nr:alpha/beta hydrolase [bacterium]